MKKLLRAIFSCLGYELQKKRKTIEDLDVYKKLYGEESVSKRRFYNISAGAYKGFGGGINHPCWTNIDVDRSWKKDEFFPGAQEYNPDLDIAHDLLSMEPLPVDSCTAQLVHSRFAVDRITDEAARIFFKEIYRILKKGGIFRIVSTNVDIDLRAYLLNDMDYYFWLNQDVSIEQKFLFHVFSQTSSLYHDQSTQKISDEELRRYFKSMNWEDALNLCASKCSVEVHKNNRYDHFNWWNQMKFKRMLSSSGFKRIFLSHPTQSSAPVLRNKYYFDNEHNNVMMYFEGVKG